jgi:hypothetical protein
MHSATRNIVRSIAVILAFTITVNPVLYAAATQSSSSQVQTAPSPYAPLPGQIARAHKVFLSNAGGDARFPVDATLAYSQVYAALQAWGHFQLVTTPAEADLVFELRDAAPETDYTGYHDREYSIVRPVFQLSIIDPQTNAVLWAIDSPAEVRGSGKTRARWMAVAVDNLLSRIKVVSGQPLTESETAELTDVPQHHYGRNAMIALGAVVAAGAIGGVLLHNAFENSLADQKASQDAFCTANHIPLSECAGG